MPKFYVSLLVSFGQMGPDEIEAPDASVAVAIAQRDLLGSLDAAVLYTTGPRRWRFVVRDEQQEIVADVPALTPV